MGPLDMSVQVPQEEALTLTPACVMKRADRNLHACIHNDGTWTYSRSAGASITATIKVPPSACKAVSIEISLG